MKDHYIYDYLRENHLGGKNAITSRQLQDLFDMDGRDLRSYIRLLRKGGYPVCSDSRGYFVAKDQKEIDATIYRLETYMDGLLDSIIDLKKVRPDEEVLKAAAEKEAEEKAPETTEEKDTSETSFNQLMNSLIVLTDQIIQYGRKKSREREVSRLLNDLQIYYIDTGKEGENGACVCR